MATENNAQPQSNPSSSNARPKQPEAKRSAVLGTKLSQIEQQIVSIFSEDVESYRQLQSQDIQDPEMILAGVVAQLERRGKGDVVVRLKSLMGISESDDVSVDAIKTVGIRLDKVLDALQISALDEAIPAKHQGAIAEAYSKAIAKKLDIAGYEKSIKDAYDRIVTQSASNIESPSDFAYYLRKFFKEITLSDQQKKEFQQIHITYADFQDTLVAKGVATQSEIADVRRTGKLPAGGTVESAFGSIAKLYGSTVLKETLKNAKEVVKEQDRAYTFPGLSAKLASYGFTDTELEGDATIQAKIAASTDEVEIQKLRIQAILPSVQKKDPTFGVVLKDMINHDFDMSKVSSATQKGYLDSVKDFWMKSDEGKNFIGHLVSSFDIVRDDVTKIVDDLFDPNKKTLSITTNKGDTIALNIEKHWIAQPWSAKTAGLFMKHGLPLVFVLSSDSISNDTMQYLAKGKFEEEKFLTIGGQKITEGNRVVLQHKTQPAVKCEGYLVRRGDKRELLQNPTDVSGKPLPDDVFQYDVVEKKDTYIADGDSVQNIVSAFPLMKASGEMSEAEHNKQDKLITKELLQKKLSPEFTGVDEAFVNSPALEQIDWSDENAVLELSTEELLNARNYYNKKAIDLSDSIAGLVDEREHIAKQISAISEKLDDPKFSKGYSTSDKAKLEQRKKEYQKDSAKLKQKIDKLEAAKKEAEKTRDRIQILLQQKKQRDKSLEAKDPNTPPEDEHDTSDAKVGPSGEIHDPISKPDSQDKMFKEAWNLLQGDEKAPLAKGSVFFVELGGQSENILPGWKHPWAKATIESYDVDSGKMVVVWSGVDAYLEEGVEGQKSTIYGAGGFDALKNRFGRIIRFQDPQSQGWGSWGLNLKQQSGGWKLDKEHKDYLDQLTGSIDFGSWYRKQSDNKISKEESNRIKYIGSRVSDLEGGKVVSKKLWFEVKDNKDGTMTLAGKDKRGQTYKKTFDPNSLLIFMMDKGLTTYTQGEVDAINNASLSEKERAGAPQKDTIFDDIVYEELPGAKQKFKFTNINSLKHCWKQVVKGLKDKFDKKQKEDDESLEDDMLTSKWFKNMGKLKPPILGSAFKEMYEGRESAIDKRKTREIDDFMKEPDEKGASSSPGATIYIKDEIIDKVERGDMSCVDTPKKRRRAAGFYLYTLSKGNPYLRALSKYAGKGLWVKAILGPSYQKNYLAWHASLLDYVRKNPWDKEKEELLRSPELSYMKQTCGGGKDNGAQAKLNADFGQAFFTKGLGRYEGEQYKTSLINDAAEAAKWKGFNQLYNEDWFGPFEQLRIPDMIGTLETMGEKIRPGDSLAYRNRSMCLALPLLTGQHVTDMNSQYKKRYANIARRFTTPFGSYVLNNDGQKKIRDLFGVISESDNSITESFLKKFPNMREYDDRSKLAKFSSEMQSRWFSNGATMLSYLSDPGKLFEIVKKLEKQRDSQGLSLEEKQKISNKILVLNEYINKKCRDNEKEAIEGSVDGESIIYSENIMTLSEGFVRDQMLNFGQGGVYRGKTGESAPKLWSALTQKIQSYSDTAHGGKVSPELYAFMLKRFVDYFERWGYAGSKAEKLIAAIKTPFLNPSDTTSSILKIAITDNIDPQGNNIPSEVGECLTAFENFFARHRPDKDADVKKIIREVFGRDKEALYDNITATGAANKGKNEITIRNKAILEEYMKKYYGVNYSKDGKVKLFRNYNGEVVYKDGNPATLTKKPTKNGVVYTDALGNEFFNYNPDALESYDAYRRESALNRWDNTYGDEEDVPEYDMNY